MINSKKDIYLIQGKEDSIKKLLEAIRILGEVKNINIQKLEYKGCDILEDLTTDQRKILSSAKKHGYYDYPRKITSEELSKTIGVNKDITIEVLRKAEKHIISKILDEN
jgi:predicted DNA binding protein